MAGVREATDLKNYITVMVLKSKGFFEGLFDENELISENVKDRDSKISFLNKVISVVSLTTGKSLTVKPSKIVAGQEPAKTNELLQCLAQALDNNLCSDEAVKQFKLGVKIPSTNDKKNKESIKPLKKNLESKKLMSKSSEKLVASDKDGQSLNKPKNKDTPVHKKESPPKKSLTKISNKKSTDRSNQEGKKNITNEQKKIPENQKPTDDILKDNQKEVVLKDDILALNKELSLNENILQPDTIFQKDLSSEVTNQPEEESILNVNESNFRSISPDKSKQITDQIDQREINNEEHITERDSLIITKNEIERGNEDTKNQSIHNSGDAVVNEVLQMEMESSRFQIPNNFDKKDLNGSSIIRPSSVRPSSSRPGAPRIRDKIDNVMNDAENIIVGKVNIISENTLHEEEEDTSIIVENNSTENLPEPSLNQEHNNLVNQNSHLVQQILDSQREFSQTSGKTEIEWQFGAQKTPDIFIQEMEQLKFGVQAISRIANPLGKLLDHIQEDVEVMRQELLQWTQLYEETSKDLLVQKNATNEALLPFHTKLKQLTTDMEERHEKITDLKISIHKNNSRIEKLLANSNVQ